MTPAADDLLALVSTGRERGGHLLTAGEAAVVRAIVGLSTDAFDLFTNLTGRVERPHPEVSVPAVALAELRERELVDGLVPAGDVARALTVPELKVACRALGLPTTGRKEDLVASLAPRRGWWTGRWFRVRHRPLLLRLERWALLEAWPDRKGALLERLGLVRWPTYPLTTGTASFPDRRSLLRWEAATGAVEPEAALEAWAAGHGAAPGRLSLVRVLADRVRAGAEAAERSGDGRRAAELYARWPGRRAVVAFRAARVREAAGDVPGAMQVLRAGLADATPTEALALVRAGRRLARTLGSSFPPAPPLSPVPLRSLPLAPAEHDGVRPRWGASARVVEDAVVDALAARGRRAWHGEAGPWRTVVSLLLAELYFLPVPGALPVPRLPGPLDLGTPAFAERRAEALVGLRARIRDEGASGIVAAAAEQWAGVRLAGVDRTVPVDVLVALAEGVPATAWDGLVELRARGRSFGGLPDLVVLPGPAVDLADAHPKRLGPGLLAVELKGPSDTLRDHQADWLHTLRSLGVTAELWEIVARSPRDRIDTAGSGHGDPGPR